MENEVKKTEGAEVSAEQKARTDARKAFYSDKDVMQMASTVRTAKGENRPFMSKKARFVLSKLLEGKKGYIYTLDSLSNDYRKSVAQKAMADYKGKDKDKYRFRRSFKSAEIISVSDLKQAVQTIYLMNKRLFVYERNEKASYVIREADYVESLVSLKRRDA